MTDRAGRRIARRELFPWFGGAAAMLAGVGRGRAAGLTALRVSCVADVTGLPALVAKDRGLFERNGLNVSLVVGHVPEPPSQSTALETLGDFDIAATTPPELIRAWQDGVDVAVVGGEAVETRDNPITHLIVRADSPVRSVADLKGRTVAFPALGAIIHVSTLRVAKQNGVDPGAVYAIELATDAMANELKAGNVDAVGVGEPVAGQLLAAGNRSIGDPLFSLGDEVPSVFWIAPRRWSQKNAEVVSAFVTALEQARDAIAADPDGVRRTLLGYARLPAPAPERIPFPTYRFAMNVDARQWAAVLKDIGEPARRRTRDPNARRKAVSAPEPEPPPSAGSAAAEVPASEPATAPETHHAETASERPARRRRRHSPRPLLPFPFGLLH